MCTVGGLRIGIPKQLKNLRGALNAVVIFHLYNYPLLAVLIRYRGASAFYREEVAATNKFTDIAHMQTVSFHHCFNRLRMLFNLPDCLSACSSMTKMLPSPSLPKR